MPIAVGYTTSVCRWNSREGNVRIISIPRRNSTFFPDGQNRHIVLKGIEILVLFGNIDDNRPEAHVLGRLDYPSGRVQYKK